MGMKDSAKKFSAKLKLDSHHTIERFIIVLGVMMLGAVVIFTSAGVSAFNNGKSTLSSKVLYTPTFLTSKTQIAGEIPGVFVNTNKTRAMVLMKFSEGAQVSVNAADYQGFLTGSTMTLSQQNLKTSVDGSVLMFGSTGYMAVILDSSAPFETQVMDLTMRANNELTYATEESELDADIAADGSFQKYDQWRVFFNPGGSDAVVSPALDKATPDVGAIFNEVVVAAQEKVVREKMDSQLALMKTELARINDHTAELSRTTADGGSLRLVAPATPKQVGGSTLDEVTGNAKVADKASDLALKTNFVMPTGYDFDWRSGSVKDGYLDELIPSGSNFVSYLAERTKESPDELNVNDMKWKLNDGTDLKLDYDSDSATVKPLYDVMNKLTQAYQDYYKDKKIYQVEQYTELLDLEVQLRNVESNFTYNDSDKVMTSY